MAKKIKKRGYPKRSYTGKRKYIRRPKYKKKVYKKQYKSKFSSPAYRKQKYRSQSEIFSLVDGNSQVHSFSVSGWNVSVFDIGYYLDRLAKTARTDQSIDQASNVLALSTKIQLMRQANVRNELFYSSIMSYRQMGTLLTAMNAVDPEQVYNGIIECGLQGFFKKHGSYLWVKPASLFLKFKVPVSEKAIPGSAFMFIIVPSAASANSGSQKTVGVDYFDSRISLNFFQKYDVKE